MRQPRLVLILSALVLLGCGYPGDPLPPALNRPNRVVDLAALQRGDKIFFHFTLPSKTTEGLPVKSDSDVELRIAALPPGGIPAGAWEQASERLPATALHIDKGAVSGDIPAARFYGKAVVLGVRVHGPGGRDAGWSNLETVGVVPALATPETLSAKDAPDAVALEWHGAAPGYRVFRKTPEDKEWTLLGMSPKASYSDGTIDFGKPYQYEVQAVEKAGEKYAESEISQPITFTANDRFAPATPTGLAAVPSTRTVELVWDRNTERDFASYRIYRNGMKISDGLPSPAYSDQDVKPGVKYSYQVSAVDAAGNESARSGAVEASLP